ncbi:MAG TPA: carboxymuconolactone decarboxylase family protein [Chloroflexota bacterium]|nr:carboxymuconolactone decarboxylase family protein [Chloroflexota bacterium]
MAFVRYADEDQAPSIVRTIFEALRKQRGQVQNSQRVLAHNPEVLRASGPFVGAVGRENALPNRIKELAILKVMLINGCQYCLSHHYQAAVAAGVSMEEMRALYDFEESPLFSEKDRAAFAYAEEITVNNRRMRPSVKDRLKAALTDAEIVDLTLACGVFNFLNRFMHCLEIGRDTDVPDELVQMLEATLGPAELVASRS